MKFSTVSSFCFVLTRALLFDLPGLCAQTITIGVSDRFDPGDTVNVQISGKLTDLSGLTQTTQITGQTPNIILYNPFPDFYTTIGQSGEYDIYATAQNPLENGDLLVNTAGDFGFGEVAKLLNPSENFPSVGLLGGLVALPRGYVAGQELSGTAVLQSTKLGLESCDTPSYIAWGSFGNLQSIEFKCLCSSGLIWDATNEQCIDPAPVLCNNNVFEYWNGNKCRNCPNGYVRSSDTTCEVCQDGKVRGSTPDEANGSGQTGCQPANLACDKTEYANGGRCKSCPLGYIGSPDFTTCEPCDEGKLADPFFGCTDAYPVPTPAPNGHGFPTPAPTDSPSNPGDTQAPTVAAPPPTPTPDPPDPCGPHQVASIGRCRNCPVGYQRDPDTLTCALCPDGMIRPNTYAGACYDAETAQTDDQGVVVGEACGLHQVASTGRCYNCPLGYERDAVTLTCAQCPDGTIRPNTYAGACYDAGTAQTDDQGVVVGEACGLHQVASTGRCRNCPLGYQRDAVTLTCAQCPDGMIRPNTYAGACYDAGTAQTDGQGVVVGEACEAGEYAGGGRCIKCPNKYEPSQDLTGCVKAAA